MNKIQLAGLLSKVTGTLEDDIKESQASISATLVKPTA
jgi:hypothetical protein